MKKIILGLAAAAVVAVAAPGLASADVSTNGTTNDSHGYATANHLHNFNVENGVQLHGIGWARSTETGQQVASIGGHRGAELHSDWITSQGDYAPISNNG
jgi:hypothetical protein